MPASDFLASHSMYIENVMRHCFLYELARVLLTRDEPRMVTILNSEVDDSGVDIVLTFGSITRHIQMKTINKRHAPNPYNIASSLWSLPGACVIWMTYDPFTMRPLVYHLLGARGNGFINEVTTKEFPAGKRKKSGAWAEREGYRGVKSADANQKSLSIEGLIDYLFDL